MLRDNEVKRRSFLRYGSVTAATAATIGLSGCIGDDDDDDVDDDDVVTEREEVEITQGVFIDTPDPNDHIASPDYNILDHVYEPLFNVTPDLEIQPRVVTDWEISGEGTMDLTIRDDVVFHNGDDLVASDVAYTFNRMLDDDIGPASDQAAGQGSLTGAEAVDDTTVRVSHEASATLAEFQFGNFARAVNEDWVADQETTEGAIVGDTADAFNGTGPYEVAEYSPDDEIVFERFDDYWGDAPPIERVIFDFDEEPGGRVSSLLADETDLIDNVLPDDVTRVQDEDGVEIRNETSLRSIFLVMKNGVAPFDSKEFRQAMNYAVDVDAIVSSLLNDFGEETSQPTLEGHFGHDSSVDPYPHDPERAEELIEESGYTDEEIEIHTPTGRYLRDTDVAATAADQIDQLDNVSATHRERDTQELFSQTMSPDMSDSPDIFLIGWGNPTFDAGYAMNPWFMPGPFHHFENAEIHSLLEDAMAEPDVGAREGLLQEANALAHEEASWVFLHQQVGIYGINDDLAWDAREDEDIRLDEIQAYVE